MRWCTFRVSERGQGLRCIHDPMAFRESDRSRGRDVGERSISVTQAIYQNPNPISERISEDKVHGDFPGALESKSDLAVLQIKEGDC